MHQLSEILLLSEELRNTDWLTESVRKKLLNNVEVLYHFKKEGYWATSYNDNSENYPTPQENSMTDEDVSKFLVKLDLVEKKIKDKSLNQAEYFRFMGYSNCRCCGQKNGTCEFIFNGWSWPEGYRHYIQVHKVMPTEEFEVFIAKIYFRLTNNYSPKKLKH